MSQMIRFTVLASALAVLPWSAAGEPGFDQTSRTTIDTDYVRLGIFPVTGDRGLFFFIPNVPRAGEPQLFVHGEDGRLFAAVRLELPEAMDARVKAAATLPPGAGAGPVVVASVYALGAGGQTAGLLAFVERGGRVIRMVRTNPYLATYLRSAPDGSFWALGWDIEGGANASATGILRHYSSNGELLGSYLPRGQFRAYGKQHPVFLTSEEGSAVLDVTGDRVGMFLPSARLWLETDYQGRELSRVPVTLPALPGGDPPNDLVGAGRIVASGQLLVWLRSGRYVTLDRTTGRFDSPRPRVEGRGSVLGVEGDKALVGGRRQSPNEIFAFEWVPVADLLR